jgi:p-hydroxybenzoate 3-monooxygenase
MTSSAVDAGVGVIGAGPAGLLSANLLVRAGIDCVVFERLPEDAVRARARAGLIEARTVALLDRHGLADGMRSRGSTSGACEFRRAGVRHVFDYSALTGARHHVYPQQLLVADLIDTLRAGGGDVRFGCPVEQVRVAGRPAIMSAAGEEVACEFVLGCDGSHGVTRAAVQGAAYSGVDFGAEWLALLAEVPPSSDHTVYGLHPDGFAGHMLRSTTVSRFYLQVAPGSDPESWADQLIWDQLAQRLVADGIELIPGPIIERGILELHSYVTEPMQHGPVFLAGDAAHIVTPAGGKGMNLALQDADELVAGLLEHYQRHDDRRLNAYSTTRLSAVWRAVEFSHWMLDLLLARPAEGRFREGLRQARLARLMAGGAFARYFARTYVGTDGAV